MSAAFSPDGSRVVTVSEGGTARAAAASRAAVPAIAASGELEREQPHAWPRLRAGSIS